MPFAGLPLTVCGAPRKDWSAAAKVHWHSQLNGCPTPAGEGKASSQKFYFYRGCTYHLTYRTAEAANNHDRWLACTLCDSQAELPAGYSEASAWAKAAAPLLQQHAGGGMLVTEEKALGRDYGAFDFTLLVHGAGEEPRRLYFDVDGETHEEACWDTAAGQQWERDRAKDEAAWEAGLMLVRLHYSDLKFWAATIQKAVAVARRQQRHRLLWYTKAHGLEGRCQPL